MYSASFKFLYFKHFRIYKGMLQYLHESSILNSSDVFAVCTPYLCLVVSIYLVDLITGGAILFIEICYTP